MAGMDPLVRASFRVQRAFSRGAGLLTAAGFGVYLSLWLWTGQERTVVDVAALALFVLSFGLRLRRRLVLHSTRHALRVDAELFAHLMVLAQAFVHVLPGGAGGPFHALVYLVLMLAAAFARPGAMLVTLLVSTALEVFFVRMGLQPGRTLLPHLGFGVCFAFLNTALFRAEIARVRRLSAHKVETELERMREAARSYRLAVAESTAAEASTPRESADPARLLQSGVDEIQASHRYALDLLQRSLGLHSVVLLWLDKRRQRLRVREVLSNSDALASGPFGIRDGFLGAALSRGTVVALSGSRAIRQAAHYSVAPALEALAVAPVVANGEPCGLLVVDRLDGGAFREDELAMVEDATQFMLRAVENERIFVQLQRTKHEQERLYRAVEQLAAASSEVDVIEAGVNSAREFASFDFALVTLHDRVAGEHEICAASGDGLDHLVGARFGSNGGLVAMVTEGGHALPYRGDHDELRQVVFARDLTLPKAPSLLVLPLTVHDRTLGTLVLGSRRAGAFGDAVRPTLEVLASHVAVSLDNARMVKRLEELATTDGLTGLFNKRTLVQMAHQKVRSALRFKKPLSLLVTDIDKFKNVNDTYGHDVGDVVIKGLGDILRRVKRETDVVGRFGGEEFVIVCEETDSTGAALLADRIRKELEATTFHTELGPLTVTCSLGVATCPGAGSDYDALFKATDEALYISKRSGRNRTTIWTPQARGAA